tara:strand:- start:604 stop:909 length:306 start_codon:yes stop_codon:yes gene_type:complete
MTKSKEIDHILEIEKVKKEADQLMMNKIMMYESKISDLENKIADLEEVSKSKDYFQKPDYQFLVNENHRLEQQYLEAISDNKKLARQIEDQIDKLRKAGLL